MGMQMANKILKSQMSIDDKIKYGDFIIRNEGSIERTGKEVNELWKKLKQIQKNQKGSILTL
jgi:dephospho-CoA kinase